MRYTTILLAATMLFSFNSCTKKETQPDGPFLVFKFKFDPTQVRYDSFGNVTTIPNGTGDQGPGTHTVTVYDAGGCSAEATVNVIFPCDSLYSVNDADGNSYHVIAIGNQCCISTQSL